MKPKKFPPILNGYTLREQDITIEKTTNLNNDYLVLIFSNPDICPDSYNFGQPYIVAKKFTEILNAANL